jgi:hypothetical protein
MESPSHTVFAALAATPRRLASLFVALDPMLHRVRPPGQPFAFAEHLWHLADLETEAFQPRLRRLAEEDFPFLADFDGNAAARLRDYLALDPAEGLRRFAAARARSLEAFGALPASAWGRRGEQQGAGELSLAELPCGILKHDQAHLAELHELLKALRRDELLDLLGDTIEVGACA